MKVEYKGETYNLQWPEKFDDIVQRAGDKNKTKGGFVSWRRAEINGDLVGLPLFLSYRSLSHRYSFLKCSKVEGFKERKRAINKACLKKSKKVRSFTKERQELFRSEISGDIKESNGWKSKSKWTEEQREILKDLTVRHRRSKKVIDWESLVNDPDVELLPYQDRFKLMKYFGQCVKRRKTRKQIKDRRADAIRYKYENYDDYLKGQQRRFQMIKNSVNDFLISQLELR